MSSDICSHLSLNNALLTSLIISLITLSGFSSNLISNSDVRGYGLVLKADICSLGRENIFKP